MRHNTVSLKTLISLMLALIGITNWTSILALSAAADSSKTNTYNSPQAVAATPASASSETKGRAAEAYAKLPVSFEANQGQTDSSVKFISRGSHHALFLTSNESVLVLDEPATRSEAKRRRAVLRMKLEGANASVQVEGIDELPGKTNYFIGKDAGQWRTEVPSYERVQYREVYPGVDLVYYENRKGIEYDFVVAAGANYKSIRLAIAGAKKARIDGSGDLVLTTEVGEIRQQKPMAYQEVEGVRRSVDARYRIDKKHKVGFEIGEYDRRLPLVIDPVLDYSTYLGGTNTDEGRAIVVDGSGNAYITGDTSSFNFPTTKDAFDTTYANSFDVFVTKLNAAGSAMIYSTYIGGNSQDQGLGIFVDSAGIAYITGFTNSPDFSVTAGVVQPMLNGSFDGDAFVTKLNSTGTALVYSTFLGGSFGEQGTGIAVDSSGNAYVTGFTESTTFPTTMGAFQSTNGGSSFSNDAFVTKLNATATALVYSTYLGGTSEDQGAGIAVDSTGRAFVAGSTNSSNFDVTAGAFQTTFGGSSGSFSSVGDAFVTEFNSTGTALVYSTYLGGTGNDGAFGLAVNASGEAFICGSTASFNLPVTPGAVRILNGGIAKTTNSASTWGAVNNGLTDGNILSIAIDPVTPATVYTGTNQGGIFKSTNGGTAWSPINSGLTSLTIRAIAINPATPSTLYLGTANRGVFKSTDSGASWKAINTGQGGGTVNALVLDPSNPATIYAGTDSGVFKTTNSGANWTGVNMGLNSTFIQSLTIDPVNPSNLYVGTFTGVYFTRNGGQNWSPSSLTNAVIRSLRVDPLTPANVYGGGDQGVFKSTDAGVTWQGRNTGLTNRIVSALAINPANSLIVYAGTGNGVFKSTDGGNIWASVSTGLAGAEISALAIDPVTPTTLYAGSTPGGTDGFVARLISSGAGLTYCTYLGGDEFDTSSSIAVDSSKNAYVTGSTSSRNFPTTTGTFQSLGGNFNSDAYVTKLTPTGNGFGYSTYLGGNSSEQGFGIAVNSSGNAYVTGTTSSTDFPITSGAFQTTLGNFSNDGFVAKLDPTPSLTSDLRIDLTGPSGTFTANSFINYTITVTNDGPDPAFAVTVTGELSPFTTFSSCNSNFSCSGSGNTVTFNINKLEPFATFTGNVSATVNCSMPDGSTITNTAKVESPTPDPVPSNNMDSVSNSGSNPPPMLSSTSLAFTEAGGSSSVTVTTSGGCPWTAVSNASWIHITFSSNCCNGVVNYTVDANSGPPRIGTMTIAGITFTVQQSGVTTSETIGVYDPPTRTFYLRNSNTPGNADIQVQYGPANAVPVVGDWNGDGVDTIGVYEPSTRTFYLRNSNTVGNADLTIQYGPAGAIPIVGDWNGDGTDTIGAYDPATRTFYLRNSNTIGNADIQIQYGPLSVVPVAGAWAALGMDTIGVYEPGTRTFYLRNANTPGPADIQVQYGPSGSVATVGDFDNNGSTTIGVYETSTRTFYLKNSNGPGNADIQIQYGPAGATPLIGDWDGQ
jgi:uncharacterized repeat protein (TIGR01451 family)